MCFTIVFSFGMEPSSGASLMFQTLPLIFSQIQGGYFLSLLFFLLLLLAALTSQISAMEPLIAYLIDTKKWSRQKSVLVTGVSVLVFSVPCALSFGLLKEYTLFQKNLFDLLSYLCVNILIPIGGFAAVILVGWRWGQKGTLQHLREGAEAFFKAHPILEKSFFMSIKYVAPLFIIFVMLDALGIFAFNS